MTQPCVPVSPAAALKITLLDDTVLDVRRGETGVTGLRLASGTVASADLYVDLADVYRRFDRLDEARRLYRRALLIDPANEDARRALDLETPPSGDGLFRRLFKRP